MTQNLRGRSATTVNGRAASERRDAPCAKVDSGDRPITRPRDRVSWFSTATSAANEESVSWLRVTPFIGLHLACLAAIWVGISAAAATVAALSYVARLFAITAFYHRCFAHRAFRTNRTVQFVFAVLGASATQRGPLWWAAHHRQHHAHTDTPDDPHSPQRGFWWSHMGWFLCDANYRTPMHRVRDLARFPELRWLNRFDLVVPIAFAAAMFGLGEALHPAVPETNGWQMLVWGYVISTVALMHTTFMINSMAHRFGNRRFATADESRNNGWLALLTMGEGWHNNHHRQPTSARLGFYWWQLDLGWLGLRLLAALGLVRDLNTPSKQVLSEGS